MKNGAFTLIEILIVIAIISVLMSLAVPQYRKYQWKAKSTEVKVILSAIASMQEAYSSEKGVFLTSNWNPGGASSKKRSWNKSGNLENIVFSVKGGVFCDYAVAKGDYSRNPEGASPEDGETEATDAVDITMISRCDIDGDGKYAYYTITDETTEVSGPYGDDF